MKKIIAFTFFLIIQTTYSQNGWQTVYGGSDTYLPYYNSICFTDEMTGYLMGFRFYKKTSDGGITWNRTDSVGSSNYFFLNSQTGWAFGNSGLYYTSNAGTSWTNINQTLNSNSLFFLNISTGFSCGSGGAINKTTNGGQSWINLNSGFTDKLNTIHFMNNNYGVCAGDWGTILTTTNGGNNWIKYTDINLGFFNKVSFIDEQTGFVAGTGGYLFRTTNSGINWQAIYTGFYDEIVSFFFTGQNTGYIFGSYGNNIKTTNAGFNWSLHYNTAFLGKVFSVTSTPSGIFWCAADSGSVHLSVNDGENWQLKFKQFITYADLNDVRFTNSITGWVCGNNGTLLRSTNGGTNWNIRNLSSSNHLKSVVFLNSNTGFICGGNGYSLGIIYKTTDEGSNWITVYHDSASLNSIYFLNNNTGWAVGNLGTILKTTDSGQNWNKYRHPYITSLLYDVAFIDEYTGFITRTNLWKSTNGGMNWFFTMVSTNPYSIQFLNSATGYFSNTSSNCIVYKSTNSGINWTQFETGSGTANSLYFINVNTGWLAGSNIKKTTNGGINWHIQTSLYFPATINSVYFYNESSGWAVGNKGTILKTTNGGIGITQISSEIPIKFNLYQNFPNPFNPVTKIRFNIPAFIKTTRRVVSLRIYDVLGKEIAVMVNEKLNPGTYEVNWDAANYSSGVYFYSLISDSFIQTRKMVLIK